MKYFILLGIDTLWFISRLYQTPGKTLPHYGLTFFAELSQLINLQHVYINMQFAFYMHEIMDMQVAAILFEKPTAVADS